MPCRGTPRIPGASENNSFKSLKKIPYFLSPSELSPWTSIPSRRELWTFVRRDDRHQEWIRVWLMSDIINHEDIRNNCLSMRIMKSLNPPSAARIDSASTFRPSLTPQSHIKYTASIANIILESTAVWAGIGRNFGQIFHSRLGRYKVCNEVFARIFRRLFAFQVLCCHIHLAW
jgi:hypothetical protein